MAPELICLQSKNPTRSRFSDIWSLGCVVFELTTGKTPFHKHDEVSLLLKLTAKEITPVYPAGISDELRDFFDCCF